MANEVKIVVRTADSASKGFGKIGEAATGMNSAIEAAGSALDSIDAIQQSGVNKSEKLARAHIDVEQAMIDNEQAALDLEQAQNDLNQASIDGAQAGVDLEQAQIDQKQANLDATTAQKDYNKAVKEHGKNSDEARQAAIDLTQARADSSQADVDAEQAVADLAQAQDDGKQATTDLKQASTDAKTAQLDLNAAQREVDPTFIQNLSTKFQEVAPAIGLAAVAADTMSKMLGKTKVASAAAAVATKAMALAQLALNLVMSANPIGLVIVAIGLLAVGLALAWKNSETFRRVMTTVFKAVSEVILSHISGILGMFQKVFQVLGKLPGKAGEAFRSAAKAAGAAKGKVDELRKSISNIKSKKVDISVHYGIYQTGKAPSNLTPGGGLGFMKRTGGVIGQAASGGHRSGLTWVNEAGPELLDLPPGTRVRSNPDSERIAGNANNSGSGELRVTLDGTGLLKNLRAEIKRQGGNVQAVLGT